MPERRVATEALAQFLGVLSHSDRIRIVEELRQDEKDVTTLADLLETSTVRVSQHLALLRTHRVVLERREGRHVYYRLQHPRLARWLIEGMAFVSPDRSQAEELREAVEKARYHWTTDARQDSSQED